MSLKVICTMGCPASGKSTWATKAIHELPGTWVRVSRDDFRATLNGGDPWQHYGTAKEKSIEIMTVDLRNYAVELALHSGLNVIVDECNIRSRTFFDLQNLVEDMAVFGSSQDEPVLYEIEEKVFYVSLDEAIERNARRLVAVETRVVSDIWSALGGADLQSHQPRTFSATKMPRASQQEM